MDIQPLAVCRDYDDVKNALRARADEKHITRERTDAEGGLPLGYAGKLLAPTPVRSLGATSLGPLLSLFGLALIIVEDTPALRELGKKRRKPA